MVKYYRFMILFLLIFCCLRVTFVFMPSSIFNEVGVHIVSPLSICTSVLSVRNKSGFRSIYFEKISVLDSNFIHK